MGAWYVLHLLICIYCSEADVFAVGVPSRVQQDCNQLLGRVQRTQELDLPCAAVFPNPSMMPVGRVGKH